MYILTTWYWILQEAQEACASADGAVEISCTIIAATSCTTNPQRIEVMELQLQFTDVYSKHPRLVAVF